ncbi:uncharacterized protein V6R79_019543 [Siganus canaliculatus]
METAESEALAREDTNQEFRILVTSKKQVTKQVNKYKEILQTALDGQTDIDGETKRVLLQELLANFEAAVQDNVLVNGQTWEEAPDDGVEDEAIDLESLLDDTIVETTRRRRVYPRQILPHVVHSLKAERKLLGLYENTVKPQEVAKDPDQENLMKDLSAAAPSMVKEAVQVLKSIRTLQDQTQGLCQVLSMKPSAASLEIHQEVFGGNSQSNACQPPPVGGATGSRKPIKRAVEDAAAADCYVPPSEKKPAAQEVAE